MKQSSAPDSLRDLLRRRGLSYNAASVLAGVDVGVISRIVNGKRQARPETIVKLARALGVSAKRLQMMTDAAFEAAHSESENAA